MGKRLKKNFKNKGDKKIMKNYNYFEAVKEDVKNYIENDINILEALSEAGDVETLKENLHDDLWVNDSVTGNASGSYTFSTYEAEENLCHNIELLKEALEEFGCGIEYLERGAEACDVTIRCYLLGQALQEVLEEIEETYFCQKVNQATNILLIANATCTHYKKG